MPRHAIPKRLWQQRGRLILIHCPDCDQHTSFSIIDVADETGEVSGTVTCLRCSERFHITLQDWHPQGS